MERENQEIDLEAAALLRRVSLFGSCPDEIIEKLASQMTKRSYKAGEAVLLQGIVSNELFIISSGVVSVTARKDGESKFLANLKETDFFGEISLVKHSATSATVRAYTPVEIYSLDHESIHEVLNGFPEVKTTLFEKVRERNRLRLEAFYKYP